MRRYSYLSIVAILLGSAIGISGCRTYLGPASYSENGSHVSLPLPIAVSYEQCHTAAILFTEGAMEYGNTPAQAAFLDWQTGQSKALALPGGDSFGVYTFSVSPDCRTIAISDSPQIYLLDVASGELNPWGEGSKASFSPDGTEIALIRGGRETDLILRTVSTGDEKLVDLPEGLVTETSFLGDVYWGGTGSSLILMVVRDSQETFSQDLVLITLDPQVMVTTVHRGGSEFVNRPSMSSDGKYIAYTLESNNQSAPTDLVIYGVGNGCVWSQPEVSEPENVYWVPGKTTLLVTDGNEAEFRDVGDTLALIDAGKSCSGP